MKPVFSFKRGESPLLVSVPHSGVNLPIAIRDRLTREARLVPDTDWFVDRLYEWAAELGAGLLVANYSRYVIDLNRPPDNAALYAGNGTGLLPQQTFGGTPLYLAGCEPDKAEAGQRLNDYWKPYHAKLAAELRQLKQRFGFAILLDAHSIRNEVPMLFEGRLPDLNLGSYQGVSADPRLIAASVAALNIDPAYSVVLDGRFQGGFITRHYGQPASGIHALQLEMSQSVYMQEAPPVYDSALAAKIQRVLRGFITQLLQWSPA